MVPNNDIENNGSDLRTLQMAQLGILKAFHEFCEAHGLKYYMCNGTILGAVRHQGFIPWDDDIDVCMMREDYQKFLGMKEEFKEVGLLVHKILDEETFDKSKAAFRHTKVETPKIKIKRKVGRDFNYVNCWIDIWPMDGLVDSSFGRKIELFRLRICNYLHVICSKANKPSKANEIKNKNPLIRHFVAFIGIIGFGKNWDHKKIITKQENLLKHYSSKDCKDVINYYGEYNLRERYNKEVFGEGKLYPFEGEQFWGPADADLYLKKIYGDYMKLPPEDQRIMKHSHEIVFE